jgi:S1-C subfamily serine protease
MIDRLKLGLLVILLLTLSVTVYFKAPAINGYVDYVRQEQEDQILVSTEIPQRDRQAISLSANSVVRIMSRDVRGVAVSTGTVFEHKDSYYVLTVAHGIMSECDTVLVWTGEMSFLPCQEIVVIDRQIDYAVIKIESPGLATPIKINRVLARPGQYRRHYSLMNKVYYTGFPNSTGPLTISGEISGYAPDGNFFLHSYAWSGSSGSAVFSHNGKLIGLVVAIDIGRTPFGVQLLSNVVVVVPVSRFDWDKILGD